MAAETRRATAADTAAIAEIITEVVAEPEPVAFEGPLTTAEVRDWIAGDERGAIFVVEEDGRLLAFAVIDPAADDPQECSFGAWVHVAERRKGYATALAEGALAFARERGYTCIRARLPERNEPTLSYLSSIGALVPLTNLGAHFELPLEQGQP